MKKEHLLFAFAIAVFFLTSCTSSLLTTMQTKPGDKITAIQNPSPEQTAVSIDPAQNVNDKEPAGMSIQGAQPLYASSDAALPETSVSNILKTPVNEPKSVSQNIVSQKKLDKAFNKIIKLSQQNSPLGAMGAKVELNALLGFIFGLLSLFSYYGAFLFGVLGLVFSIIALNRGVSGTDHTFAIIGLITSILGILIWGGILFVI